MEKLGIIKKIFEKRRSVYALSPNTTLKDSQLIELLREIVRYVPSAFDSRSTRLVLLTGKAHRHLWQIVKEVLCEVVAPEKFARTEQKIDTSFASGYGTILFFEDEAVVRNMQEHFPLYRDNFIAWSEQTSAMHQYAVWVALAEAGMGASLQHYNPLIDRRVHEEWQLPHSWRLVAQMPFGVASVPAPPKNFDGAANQLKIFTE
jgi:predicted oxidoreductase (fatty acid repression mutant protein)